MRRRLSAIVIAAVLFAINAFAQSTTYDLDKTADFSKFKTYAWTRGTEVADQWNHARVVDAIDTQLALKGMLQVDPRQQPDVFVAYHAAFDRSLQISGTASGFLWPAARTGVARTEQILVGTLVVDVIDARTRRLVWRGTASREIDPGADPARREKNINKAAEKLFKKYPAGR